MPDIGRADNHTCTTSTAVITNKATARKAACVNPDVTQLLVCATQLEIASCNDISRRKDLLLRFIASEHDKPEMHPQAHAHMRYECAADDTKLKLA